MSMNIVIMGPAGSGKGTLSNFITKEYGIVHLSTGDILREAVASKSELGKLAQSYLDAGNLVPNNVVNKLMKEKLESEACKKGYLLDGFPRTLNQAEALNKITEEIKSPITVVINLTIDLNLLIKRITGRRICRNCGEIYNIEFNPSQVAGVCDRCGGKLYQRSDDTAESLETRLDAYHKETIPAIDYYRDHDLVVDIDAAKSIAENMEAIKSILEKYNDHD